MENQATTPAPGMLASFRRALPGWPLALAGSPAWACLMAASAIAYLWYREWQLDIAWQRIAILYFLGGLAAFAPALTTLRWLDRRRRFTGTQRFAAAFVVLAAFTIAATAFLFSQYFRQYFAQWHRDTFSFYGFLEFGFTSAAAVYYFLVGGLRQYLPLGLPALILISLWWARKPR